MTDDGNGEADDAVKAGVEQFQQAALDALAAARAMIDAAESIVKEPGAVESLVGTIGDFARTGTQAVSKIVADAGRAGTTGTARRRSADVPEPQGSDPATASDAPDQDDDDGRDAGFEPIDLS